MINVTISSNVIGLKKSCFHLFSCQVVIGQFVIAVDSLLSDSSVSQSLKSTNHIQSCSYASALAPSFVFLAPNSPFHG